MNPRIRRLGADYQRVLSTFKENPYIHIISTEGNPPEKYVFEFHIAGLVPKDKNEFFQSTPHRAEIFLPLDYPRRPPFCRMLTPVFHPNIDPQKICIGDHWSAGQTLDQLIMRIAELICYQSYNTKSPLNALAAAWVERNIDMLPLEKKALSGDN